jgi:molybdopterin molybdotransferase
MISVNEAKEIIGKNGRRKTITVHLDQSIERILSENVHSSIDVPSFDNSAMDGFAFCYDPTVTSYQIISTIKAGDLTDLLLRKGETAQIFTGAPMPKGADTVVQQEITNRRGNEVLFDKTLVKQGANVRKAGSQCKAGDVIAKAGGMITPGSIGLFASVGLDKVKVYSPPCVGIIVTGNELQEIGQPLQKGRIYNSNAPLLKAYLHTLGVPKIEIFQTEDRPEVLKEVIKMCIAQYDMLLVTGGISIGEYDFVHSCLLNEGVQQMFYKIKQKPGKPIFVGTKDDKLVFGLPGNPASVIACFNQYVKPYLRHFMGHENVWLPSAVLPLAVDVRKRAGLTHFLKGMTANGKVSILPGQDSYNMLPFNEANCLVEIGQDTEFLPAGSKVNVYNL